MARPYNNVTSFILTVPLFDNNRIKAYLFPISSSKTLILWLAWADVSRMIHRYYQLDGVYRDIVQISGGTSNSRMN